MNAINYGRIENGTVLEIKKKDKPRLCDARTERKVQNSASSDRVCCFQIRPMKLTRFKLGAAKSSKHDAGGSFDVSGTILTKRLAVGSCSFFVCASLNSSAMEVNKPLMEVVVVLATT
jgi:hypothetical protein